MSKFLEINNFCVCYFSLHIFWMKNRKITNSCLALGVCFSPRRIDKLLFHSNFAPKNYCHLEIWIQYKPKFNSYGQIKTRKTTPFYPVVQGAKMKCHNFFNKYFLYFFQVSFWCRIEIRRRRIKQTKTVISWIFFKQTLWTYNEGNQETFLSLNGFLFNLSKQRPW